jgi:D-alanine-D-alanine ligase
MKIAVVFNRDSRKVINLFGIPSREKYGLRSIRRIVDALKKNGHQVISLEGDKDLIRNLEEFMPRVLHGERPGMAFNLSYGIQGQARYTHVPGILEMAGIPYVGSGPLAHSLALDKVVSKIIFRQHGIPTPDFSVLESPDSGIPDLAFPVIAKPKNESTSMGIRICRDASELRGAADAIYDTFREAVLVEEYIEGREINVGLLGNDPVETFEPAELIFGEGGPPIYRYEDKVNKSGRSVSVQCPADLDATVARRSQEIALRSFQALGCADCARVDLRMNGKGELFVLEINSLPSLGEHGSYTQAAEAAGLDFPALINRLVEVASARYFDTPHPPRLRRKGTSSREFSFRFLTERRDRMEKRLERWVKLASRTQDPIGVARAFAELDKRLRKAGLSPASPEAENADARLWQTESGFENGTLLLVQVDVPEGYDQRGTLFQREPEWLVGEGIGVSRAPLVMLEFALRAVKTQSRLKRKPIGVLAFGDEGRELARSAPLIRKITRRARTVLVLAPSTPSGKVVVGRRGLRKYKLVVEGVPRRLGEPGRGVDVLPWLSEKISALAALSNRKARVAVSVTDLSTQSFPMLLPHRVTCTVLLSAATAKAADRVESQIRDIMECKGMLWTLQPICRRPPFSRKPNNLALAEELAQIGRHWDIPLESDTTLVPSAAGLVPEEVPALCGLAPLARDLHTPQEAVQRLSLMQRTLLLAQFLLEA